MNLGKTMQRFRPHALHDQAMGTTTPAAPLIPRDGPRLPAASRARVDAGGVNAPLTRRRALWSATGLWLAGSPVSVQALLQGPTPAQVQDETWLDTARQREVPVRIRWPACAAPDSGWPLVLFSHGLGGSLDAGTVFARAWADAGIAVLHLQHSGSDIGVAQQGMAALRAAASPAQLLARVRDVRFVMDEVARRHAAQAGPWGAVRVGSIGMGGHSFGSHTVFAAAGQRYPGGIALGEPRIRCFIAFSPMLPAGDARSALQDVTRPMMCVTGTLDAEVLANGATPDRRAAVYDLIPARPKAGLVLDGADHMTFAGQTGPRFENFLPRPAVAREQQGRHHAVLAALTTHWWRAQLLEDKAARESLAHPQGLSPADRWQST